MIEMSKLNAMLDAELEMAAAWSKMSPDERVGYLKTHPFSRFRKGGMKEHLSNLGWKRVGRNKYQHANGRTLQIHKGDTHKYNFSVTHPNGDVSHHKINNDISAAWAITKHSNLSNKQKGKKAAKPVKRVAAPPPPPPAPVAKKPGLLTRMKNFIHPSKPAAPVAAPVAPVKHRGRPVGSKNRPKVAAPVAAPVAPVAPAKHRGRPVGSKNRPRSAAPVAPPAPVAPAKPKGRPVKQAAPVAPPAAKPKAPIVFKKREEYEPAPTPIAPVKKKPAPVTAPAPKKKKVVNEAEDWA